MRSVCPPDTLRLLSVIVIAGFELRPCASSPISSESLSLLDLPGCPDDFFWERVFLRFVSGVSLGLLWTPCGAYSCFGYYACGDRCGIVFCISSDARHSAGGDSDASCNVGRAFLQRAVALVSWRGDSASIWRFMILYGICNIGECDRKFQTFILNVSPITVPV